MLHYLVSYFDNAAVDRLARSGTIVIIAIDLIVASKTISDISAIIADIAIIAIIANIAISANIAIIGILDTNVVNAMKLVNAVSTIMAISCADLIIFNSEF